MASGRTGRLGGPAVVKRTRFLISSLLAAGFTGHQDAMADTFTKATTGNDDPNKGALLRRFSQDHTVTLAQHRSHSSHSSHSSGYGGGGGHYSHTSHRSSSGGGYVPSYNPAPGYSPPYVAPTQEPQPQPQTAQPLYSTDVRASAPPSDGLPALSGRTKRFASIVRRVQIALLAQDFYSGIIDGLVGPSLRSALRKFQQSRGLDVTGTITPPTLDALMVSSQ